MAEDKMMRLSAVAKQINVGLSSIVDHLATKGFKVDLSPNTKLNFEQLSEVAKFYNKADLLVSEPAIQNTEAEASKSNSIEEDTGIKFFREVKPVEKPIIPEVEKVTIPEIPKEIVEEKVPEVVVVALPEPAPSPIVPSVPAIEIVVEKPKEIEVIRAEAKVEGLKVVGKIDLNPKPRVPEKPAFKHPERQFEPRKEQPRYEEKPKVEVKVEAPKPKIVEPIKPIIDEEPEIELIEAKAGALKGLTVLGKIVLPVEPVRSRDNNDKKKKRKRIDRPNPKTGGRENDELKTGPKKPFDPLSKPITTAAPVLGKDAKKGGRGGKKDDVTEKEVQDKIKATMARMGGSFNFILNFFFGYVIFFATSTTFFSIFS